MFASHTNQKTFLNNGRKFHRHVSPVKSLLYLTTIINLLKIDHLIIGTFEAECPEIQEIKDDRAQKILELVRSIRDEDGHEIELFHNVIAELKENTLYATVFTSNDVKCNAVTLAIGISNTFSTANFMSVNEGLLLQSIKLDQEV